MPNKCHGDGSKDARSAVAPTFIKVSHEPWLRVFFSCCFVFWRGHDVHPLKKKKKSTPASPASLRFAVSPSCSPRSSHGRYIDLFIFLPIRRVCPLCAFPASSFGFSKKKREEEPVEARWHTEIQTQRMAMKSAHFSPFYAQFKTNTKSIHFAGDVKRALRKYIYKWFVPSAAPRRGVSRSAALSSQRTDNNEMGRSWQCHRMSNINC